MPWPASSALCVAGAGFTFASVMPKYCQFNLNANISPFNNIHRIPWRYINLPKSDLRPTMSLFFKIPETKKNDITAFIKCV